MNFHSVVEAASRCAVVHVSGLKGGVAKSSIAIALGYVYSQLFPGGVQIVDFDTNNDDVAKASADLGKENIFRLEGSAKGWDAVNEIIFGADAHTRVILINTPAQFEASLNEYGRDVLETVQQSGDGRGVVTAFALGPFRDSTNLLARYCALGTAEPVFVFKAMWQADDEADFEVLERKKTLIDLRGGAILRHERAPFHLLSRVFDGVEQEVAGAKPVVERWSIARYLEEGRKSVSFAARARRVERYLAALKSEIGMGV